jgi:hypothetical protein
MGPARFAHLVDSLLREDAATRVVVFGAPADSSLFEQFETELAVMKPRKVCCRVLVPPVIP